MYKIDKCIHQIAVARFLNKDSGSVNDSQITDLLSSRHVVHIKKKYFNGTHRAADPERLLEELGPDLPQFGITRIARITKLDRIGIEVFTVARPNSRGLSVTQGKGATVATAKLSGVMEAIECWHAEHPGTPLRFASYSDMVSDFGPDSIYRAPEIASAGSPFLWTTTTNLVTGAEVWVPFDLVHASFHGGLSQRSTGITVSTNGLASGCNLYEALVHAICEVIERHATTAFGYASSDFRRGRAVDLDTIRSFGAQNMIDRCRRAGIAVKIWDVTPDIEVPCYMACLSDIRDSAMPPGYGAGSHTSREVAIMRAVSEAAQCRLTRISGARDDLAPQHYAAFDKTRARYLVDAGNDANESSQRCYEDAPDLAGDCLVADLWRVVDALKESGHDRVLALSLADDHRYSVVRVIVPGLIGLEAEL